MADSLKQCEFLLLRYLPDALTEEFVNIGVVLVESGTDTAGDIAASVEAHAFSPANAGATPSGALAPAVHLRFTRDWRRVRCLDPLADVEMLEALEADLRKALAHSGAERDKLLARLQDYCSNGIQLTTAKACLAADPAQELESLARMYLERPLERGRPARESGRTRILGQMRDAFEQAGVWALMHKKIPAADYTHAGDPLRIDCGYKVNGIEKREIRNGKALIRMFHAVSLESDTDTAKILAFSFPELRAGIARMQNARAELTAIVEPELDRSDEAISFALAVMQRSEIAVAASTALPEIAERTRVELRV